MKYTVKPGDTLSKIAKDLYGDSNRWREIVAANKDKIENPSLIRPGWELEIPGTGEAEAPAKAEPAPAQPATPAQPEKPAEPPERKPGQAGDARSDRQEKN